MVQGLSEEEGVQNLDWEPRVLPWWHHPFAQLSSVWHPREESLLGRIMPCSISGSQTEGWVRITWESAFKSSSKKSLTGCSRCSIAFPGHSVAPHTFPAQKQESEQFVQLNKGVNWEDGKTEPRGNILNTCGE